MSNLIHTIFSWKRKGDSPLLNFLYQLLCNPLYGNYICWEDYSNRIFKIINPEGVAQMWGRKKGHINMNYDKMARALRHYYRLNILKKVSTRGCYQFIQLPTFTENVFEHLNFNNLNQCQDPLL